MTEQNGKFYVINRRFELVSGKIDYQYVSVLDKEGRPMGYDRSIKYAVRMTEKQADKCSRYMRELRARFSVTELTK